MLAEGGNPEAAEIPRDKGKAIRKTKNPDCKSLRQFSFNPTKPVLGGFIGDCLCTVITTSW